MQLAAQATLTIQMYRTYSDCDSSIYTDIISSALKKKSIKPRLNDMQTYYGSYYAPHVITECGISTLHTQEVCANK